MERQRIFSVLLVLLVVSWNVQPVQSQDPAQLKINTSVELVTVPVVVHKGGQHVPSLKKENFTLLEDGSPRDISVFEEIHPVDPVAVPPNTPEAFSNTSVSESQQRLFVIAVDLVNTSQLDKAYMKQEMVKFLNGAQQRGETLALIAITDDGIHVLQDFTTNQALIAAALEKSGNASNTRVAGKTGNALLDQTPCALSAGGCGGTANANAGMKQLGDWQTLYKTAESYEIFRDRTARLGTLATLQQLAQWLSGYPGRKTLVWAGAGVPLLGGMQRVMNGGNMGDSTTINLTDVGQAMDENVHTFRILSAANVAVYPLDARHGANTSYTSYDVSNSDAPIGDKGFSGVKGRVQNDDQERIAMFQQIAGATGGKACFNQTDLARCLNDFSADSHDYYMLGFYVPKNTKPGWHKIAVKLDQKAELRNREGFDFAPPAPEKNRMSDLQLAMISPLQYTKLPISGRFAQMEKKGGKTVAHFELSIPGKSIGLGDANDNLNFDVVAVAKGTDGKEAAKFAQRIQKKLQPQQAQMIHEQGIFYTNKLELPTGTYGIWFVVRDNTTGTTGSVRTYLQVP